MTQTSSVHRARVDWLRSRASWYFIWGGVTLLLGIIGLFFADAAVVRWIFVALGVVSLAIGTVVYSRYRRAASALAEAGPGRAD